MVVEIDSYHNTMSRVWPALNLGLNDQSDTANVATGLHIHRDLIVVDSLCLDLMDKNAMAHRGLVLYILAFKSLDSVR